MTESEFTSPIVEYLRRSGCVVFKLADHFTIGVPDVVCTTVGYTTWLEMKVLERGESFRERVMRPSDKIQHFNMMALAAHGRAYYLILRRREAFLFKPQAFLKESVPEPAPFFTVPHYEPLLSLVRSA